MRPISNFRKVVLALALLCASNAIAGVTIHYKGKAHSATAVQQALRVARDIADRNGWKVEDASLAYTTALRRIDEKAVSYSGSLAGIRIMPAPMSEPLDLQFGSDFVFQDRIKTQFAGAETHIRVIELLRALKPYLVEFRVNDESEYWITGRRADVERAIKTNNETIEIMKKFRPGSRGPEKSKNGRIADLILAPER